MSLNGMFLPEDPFTASARRARVARQQDWMRRRVRRDEVLFWLIVAAVAAGAVWLIVTL